MVVSASPFAQNDEVIRLRVLFSRVFKSRFYILAIIVGCTAAFAAAAFLITPVYRATTLLIPASADRDTLGRSLSSTLSQLGGLASLAGVNAGASDQNTEEALAVLRSRQFIERFIREEDLMPRLFADKWNGETHSWKVPADKQPTPSQAYRHFSHDVCLITQDKKTGLVTLQIDWTNREEAAAWANKLVARLNLEMRDRAIEKANASVGYLEKEMASTTAVETHLAVSHLMENEVKQRMLANVTPEYAFRTVDKAVTPDRTDVVKPKKLLLLLAGPFVGLIVGIGGALAYWRLKEMW
jgi:uncharacterized protein involved in exopolysaccharide biosynthesis